MSLPSFRESLAAISSSEKFVILRHFTIILACTANTLIQQSPYLHELAIFVAGEKN
jgi:hypothetical protein